MTENDKYNHVIISSNHPYAQRCPKCKMTWYYDEKTKKIYTAQSMFVPLHEDKVCPACEDPNRKWKDLGYVDP